MAVTVGYKTTRVGREFGDEQLDRSLQEPAGVVRQLRLGKVLEELIV